MSHPLLQPVVSSNIAAIGYKNGTLVVEFRSGKFYAYEDVPVDVFDSFKASASKGQFLNSQIKGGFYTAREIPSSDVDTLMAATAQPKAKARKVKKLDFASMVLLNPYVACFF